MYPLYTNIVIAGMDKDGPKLFTLDAIGSLIPEDYGTTGTGMLLSIGILEAEYKPDISVEAGEKLVEKAIRAAIARQRTETEKYMNLFMTNLLSIQCLD